MSLTSEKRPTTLKRRNLGGWLVQVNGETIGWVVKFESDGLWHSYYRHKITGAVVPLPSEHRRSDAVDFVEMKSR